LTDLLVGLVVAATSALIAYHLGLAQGKQQTIFEEQATIMAELRRLVLETDEALFWAATFAEEAAEEGADNEDSQDELGDKLRVRFKTHV